MLCCAVTEAKPGCSDLSYGLLRTPLLYLYRAISIDQFKFQGGSSEGRDVKSEWVNLMII